MIVTRGTAPRADAGLQLHPCAEGKALSQTWAFGANGSIYSLDQARSIGYCLDIAHAQGHSGSPGTKEGTPIFASNCGPSGAKPGSL